MCKYAFAKWDELLCYETTTTKSGLWCEARSIPHPIFSRARRMHWKYKNFLLHFASSQFSFSLFLASRVETEFFPSSHVAHVLVEFFSEIRFSKVVWVWWRKTFSFISPSPKILGLLCVGIDVCWADSFSWCSKLSNFSRSWCWWFDDDVRWWLIHTFPLISGLWCCSFWCEIFLSDLTCPWWIWSKAQFCWFFFHPNVSLSLWRNDASAESWFEFVLPRLFAIISIFFALDCFVSSGKIQDGVRDVSVDDQRCSASSSSLQFALIISFRFLFDGFLMKILFTLLHTWNYFKSSSIWM